MKRSIGMKGLLLLICKSAGNKILFQPIFRKDLINLLSSHCYWTNIYTG
jgi:hypothetical protein